MRGVSRVVPAKLPPPRAWGAGKSLGHILCAIVENVADNYHGEDAGVRDEAFATDAEPYDGGLISAENHDRIVNHESRDPSWPGVSSGSTGDGVVVSAENGGVQQASSTGETGNVSASRRDTRSALPSPGRPGMVARPLGVENRGLAAILEAIDAAVLLVAQEITGSGADGTHLATQVELLHDSRFRDRC